MKRRSPLVLLAVLAFTACGADDPVAVVVPNQAPGTAVIASSTTVAVVAPTETGAPATNANDVPVITGVAPTPNANGNLGSGCVVGDDTLPDGLFATIIVQRGASLTVDLGCLGADGVFSNTNTEKLRSNQAAASMRVFLLADAGTPQEVASVDWLAQPPSQGVYWVAVNGGLVTSVQEIIRG